MNILNVSIKTEQICALPSAVGTGEIACEAYIPLFFHNTKTGNCEGFVYGGCGGNENRFGTKESCEEFCIKKN